MTVFVPQLDHWIATAALSLVPDLVAVWPMLALPAAYWSLAQPFPSEDHR